MEYGRELCKTLSAANPPVRDLGQFQSVQSMLGDLHSPTTTVLLGRELFV